MHKSRLEYPTYVYLKAEDIELLNTLASFIVNSEMVESYKYLPCWAWYKNLE